ncbi:MAG TPA: helix-turn-helix transcriptional regulator [Candidatus Binataceae bacterium]|nr:helix-turn-helix transcriptional regulator [Candidatus Binataceae bacterium]
MVRSDARNKEVALARIKRLASSGLPLEPFVRTLFVLINDAIPNSPNQAFYTGSDRSDAYICDTPEVNQKVPLHERYFVDAPPAVSGARFRLDVATMRQLFKTKIIWVHEEIMQPNSHRFEGFNAVTRPVGFHHCLMILFQESGDLAGCYPIWRVADQKPLSAEDTAFISASAPHIAYGLKTAQLMRRPATRSAEISFAPLAGWEAGSILIDQAGQPIAMDAQAQLIFQQIALLDGITVDALRLPQLRKAFDYIAKTLREIFHDPDSGLSVSVPPVARVYLHWTGIVLKLRGVYMMGADGRDYTTVLVERGETKEARWRRLAARWGLGEREAEVLRLIAESRTGPEIAILLEISHETVRKHTSAILAKLGVENRAAAAAVARDFT